MSKNEQKQKPNKSKSITLKLKYPIEFGEETIAELEIRRPKAKDIELLSASPNMKELLHIGARISNQPKPIIDKLDAVDALALVEVVGDFLDSGRKTGEDA